MGDDKAVHGSDVDPPGMRSGMHLARRLSPECVML